MKRVIKQIIDGLLQITIDDSNRWYKKILDQGDGAGAGYVPSITWILQYMPITEGLFRWYGKHGWERARELMLEAAVRGSRIHAAITELLNPEGSGMITHDQIFVDPHSGEEFELTLDEYEAVISFAKWYQYANVTKVVFREKTIWTEEFGGTMDLFCWCENPQKPPRSRDLAAQPGWNLIDFKTGQYVHDSHKAQLSAYRRAPEIQAIIGDELPTVTLAILQIGYKHNSRGWKYTAVEDCFHLFEAAHVFWKHENDNKKPPSYTLPLEVSLETSVEA